MLSGQLKRFEYTEGREQIQSSTSSNQTSKCFLFLNQFKGFIPPLSFKQCVWLSYSSLRILLMKQQLVCIYFNSSELLEEFTDCETDVFIHFYPFQRLSLNNISLCGFGFCIHSRGRGGRRGRHMAVRSTKHVISLNRDGLWWAVCCSGVTC